MYLRFYMSYYADVQDMDRWKKKKKDILLCEVLGQPSRFPKKIESKYLYFTSRQKRGNSLGWAVVTQLQIKTSQFLLLYTFYIFPYSTVCNPLFLVAEKILMRFIFYSLEHMNYEY